MIARLLSSPGLFSVFSSSSSVLLSECLFYSNFKQFIPLSKPLETVPSAPITFGITVTIKFHSFHILWQDLSTCLFLLFLFSLFFRRDSKIYMPESSLLFFFLLFVSFVNYHLVWSPGRDQVIRLCLKIPENFMPLILEDRFRFVHIPYGSMVKFQFLAQFPVNYLSHPVMSTLILLLC